MGFFSVEEETVYFGRAVPWTRLCAVPRHPQGGIGNCTVNCIHLLRNSLMLNLWSRMDQQDWQKQVMFLLGFLK